MRNYIVALLDCWIAFASTSNPFVGFLPNTLIRVGCKLEIRPLLWLGLRLGEFLFFALGGRIAYSVLDFVLPD